MNKILVPNVSCDVCGFGWANSFSAFYDENGNWEWKICCGCTSDVEIYYIQFSDFFKSQDRMVEWIAHLSEKKDKVNHRGFMKTFTILRNKIKAKERSKR